MSLFLLRNCVWFFSSSKTNTKKNGGRRFAKITRLKTTAKFVAVAFMTFNILQSLVKRRLLRVYSFFHELIMSYRLAINVTN